MALDRSWRDYLVVHSCFFGRFVGDQEEGGGAGLSITHGWMDCVVLLFSLKSCFFGHCHREMQREWDGAGLSIAQEEICLLVPR